jgi:hypothetical protein
VRDAHTNIQRERETDRQRERQTDTFLQLYFPHQMFSLSLWENIKIITQFINSSYTFI